MAAPLHLRPTRRQRDKNFFVVWKLPPHFNWQELKELVRATTGNDPGWTSVTKSPYGREGAAGSFSVRSDQDAASIYHFFTVKTTAQFGWDPVVHHFDASSQPPTLLKCNCANIFTKTVGHSESQPRTSCTATTAALGVGATSHWQSTPPLGPHITPLQCRGLTVLDCNARVQPPASQPARYRRPFSGNFMPTNVCRAPIRHANGISFARPGMEVPYGPPRSLNRSESRKTPRQHKLSTGRAVGRNHAISWTCTENEAGNFREYSNGPSSKDRQPLSKNVTGLKFASGSVIVNGAPQRLRSQ